MPQLLLMKNHKLKWDLQTMYVFNLVFIYIVFWLHWRLIPSYVTLFLFGIFAETTV